jgi:hypothetical protein
MSRYSLSPLILSEGTASLWNDVDISSLSDNEQCPGIPLKYYGLGRIFEILLDTSL